MDFGFHWTWTARTIVPARLLRMFVAFSAWVVASTIAWAEDRLVPAHFATIQEAINAAWPGDHVIVSAGAYHERIDFLDRSIIVRSVSGPADTVIDSTGIAGSTVRAVGVPQGVTLEGFTIRGGSAKSGGGLYVLAAPMALRDCVVVECDADSAAGAFFAGNQSIVIERCRFEGLSSAATAAIFSGAFTTIVDSTFAGNRAGDVPDAGVIKVVSGGSLVMSRCLVRDNVTPNSNAVTVSVAPATFTDCIFERNAGRLGGAVGKTGNSTAHFSGCMFEGNTAAQGGAVNLNNGGASATFENCAFIGNHAIDIPLSGGAFGGAIFGLGSSGALTVRRCLFADNTSINSGGAINTSSSAACVIESCVFRGNTTGGNGGAVRRNGSLALADSKFKFNHADLQGDALHLTGNNAVFTLVDSWFCGHDHSAITGLAWRNLGGVIVQTPCTVPGDVSGDGLVDVDDLLLVIGSWGPCVPASICPNDLSADGVVDVEDLFLVLANAG